MGGARTRGAGPGRPSRRTALVLSLAVSLLLAAVSAGIGDLPARADTAPDPGVPATVSTDPLPTAQIDGVALVQLVVGNTVYVGGDFATARPAGAAAGSQTVPRANLLAYDVTTGQLVGSFAPDPDGPVRTLAVSPDGGTLYVGGSFLHIAGQARSRIAAFDVATGALRTSFAPTVDYSVYGISVTSDTVYLGGAFSHVNGVVRKALAAVTRSNGTLTGFNPDIPTGNVRQVITSPDESKVVIGGNFETVNGSSNPGYGLAMLDPTTSALLPLPVNNLIRDGRTNSSIMALQSTAEGFYGSGYAYAKADGNLEGAFRADWDGNLVWVESCHGDTYSTAQVGSAVYVAGHPHDCSNVAGWIQTSPPTYQRGLAFSTDARGVASRDQSGYYNYAGQPRPQLLSWFPDFNVGTYTGKSQGPWTVSGNDDYVVYGGEFTKVNNVAQQGLVRFAVTAQAPNHDGPRLSGSGYVPTVQQFGTGVRLSWPANYDRDNELLTYEVVRDGASSSPVFTTTARSTFWQRPVLSFLDRQVAPGQTHTYRIRTRDPMGNVAWGDPVSVTVTGGAALSTYDQVVLADGPRDYWPLAETSGTAVADLGLTSPATSYAGVTRGVSGAIAGDPGTAYRFNGASTGYVATNTAQPSLQVLSVEAWFKTTSTSGGKIIGWGNRNTSASTSFDRHLYLSNSGRVYFGVNGNGPQTVNTAPGYNDGRWHHAVATLSPTGMKLYLDGALAASRPDAISAQIISGYWRIGGDAQGTSWPGLPASGYLAGDLDDVAVYPVALTADQVAAHHTAGVSAAANQPPTAAFTATPTGLNVAFDGSGSHDPDGSVTGYAWTFGDGGTATGPTPNHGYSGPGTYTVGLQVTDNGGATATHSQQVTVTAPAADAPFVSDTFDRTLSSGLGSADVGGAWTVSSASGFAVSSGGGLWKLSSAGTTRTAYLGSTLRTSTDLTTTFSSDKASSGSGLFLSVLGRRVDATSDYRGFVKVTGSNAVQVSLQALQGSSTATTLAGPVTLPGTYTAGTPVHVRLQVVGSSPTTVRIKVWTGSAAEPSAWTLTASNGYAGLQQPGAVGFSAYASSTVTNAPVTVAVTDLTARPATN